MAVFELSQAAYARRRGVTPKAIEKAIDAGRIPISAVRRDGNAKLIDVAAADFALGQSRLRVNVGDDDAPLAGELPLPENFSPSPPPLIQPETPRLTQARTETEQYNARLKQLDFEQRIGKVCAIEDVTRSMEVCATAMVRDLDQLPARADDIATAFTRHGIDGVRALLKQIAREIRATMANNMRMLTADETADDDTTEEAIV